MVDEAQVQTAETIRRVDRLERDLSTLTDKVISLSDLTVQTNTNVENLISQVSNLFGRTQPKPPDYRLWVAFVSLIIVIGAAVLTPLFKSDTEQKKFDITVMEHLVRDARETGKMSKDIEWLKEMEERLNQRLHGNLK